jgi:SAM-dependent methyltransferase
MKHFLMDRETEFLTGLMELGYGEDVEEKLKNISKEVPWASNWPMNLKSFWNAEAFMWEYKISKEKRNVIKSELESLNGKNLDLGCGAYSYVKNSVGFDLSPKMLSFNDNCIEKVEGDLEEDLPFSPGSFGSITAVFVLNYVKNLSKLFSNVRKILNDNGTFVAVLSAHGLNEWQKRKEVNHFSFNEWINLLQDSSFSVKSYEKKGLWFFRCEKCVNIK